MVTDDFALPLQQGQGVQQPGDELGGHVAGEPVGSRREHPSYGERAVLELMKDAFLAKEVEVGLEGPLHQPPPAGENAAPPNGQRHGDQEA